MGISQPAAGIFDASGRFIAPAEGNASYQPAPVKFCSHGQLCPACAKQTQN